MKPDLSVIIPSRNERFLVGTVQNILSQAKGSIEVVIVLDEDPFDHPILNDPRVKTIHFEKLQGLKKSINAGVKAASGKYIMKCDAHCMFESGFDEVLKADCEEDWIVIPTRYSLDVQDSLDPSKWTKFKYPINYHYFTFPYGTKDGHLSILHWREKHEPRLAARAGIMVDDTMTFQGSCWFMHREYYRPADHGHYHNLQQEGVELALRCWLSGGRVVINKNTWYAHLHKGWTHLRGYFMGRNSMKRCAEFATDYWMNDRWPGAIYPMRWLVDKFWPLPGWPDDWEELHRKMGKLK